MRPREEIIDEGIKDLIEGRESVNALLVSIGAPRLARLGIAIPDKTYSNPEHRLYNLLRTLDADASHSRYNALIRRLVSFERAGECGT